MWHWESSGSGSDLPSDPFELLLGELGGGSAVEIEAAHSPSR